MLQGSGSYSTFQLHVDITQVSQQSVCLLNNSAAKTNIVTNMVSSCDNRLQYT